ncbi:MAG: hypothetical protein K8I60_08760 [Anaerolineae bacterium]|nr:hypothetical protein [Anaerolineae bacterium]
MNEEARPIVALLDTSPLISFCAFEVRERPIIEYILPHSDIVVVDTVAKEATANPQHRDSALITKLLRSRTIKTFPTPTPPLGEVIDLYTKLGQGERDTLRSATMMPFARLILDDYLAFVIAARFGLQPILLLDFVVLLIQQGKLDLELGHQIVNRVAPRYSLAFIEHTRHKLREIES